MKYTFNFDEFLFESVFKSSNNKMYFNLSKRLYNLLISINHKIAKDLVILHNEFNELYDMTYIDYHDDDYNLFTFARSPKIYDELQKLTNNNNSDFIRWYAASRDENDEIWTKYRSDIRIGRFINRIFPNKYKESGAPGEDIQSFIDNIKSKRSGVGIIFKIVEGDDIIKYYNVNSYSLENGEENNLHNSCMKYDKCSSYLDFYIKNDVKMVILMSENDDKINGRAILWKLTSPDRYFMDRVYTIYNYDVETFKNYAIKNNWLYKKHQNREPDEMICDPSNNTCENMDLIVENIKITERFPYLDTLSFLYKEHNILSNNDNLNKSGDKYYLQSTDGYYTVEGKVFVPYYNRLINQDELTWCYYGQEYRFYDDVVWVYNQEEYATKEYAKEHLYYSELMNKWINKSEEGVIYLDEYDDYVTDYYAENYMNFSNFYNNYILEEDSIWSKYHNDYILKDESIKIKYVKNNEEIIDYAHETHRSKFKLVKNEKDKKSYYVPKNKIKNEND